MKLITFFLHAPLRILFLRLIELNKYDTEIIIFLALSKTAKKIFIAIFDEDISDTTKFTSPPTTVEINWNFAASTTGLYIVHIA